MLYFVFGLNLLWIHLQASRISQGRVPEKELSAYNSAKPEVVIKIFPHPSFQDV